MSPVTEGPQQERERDILAYTTVLAEMSTHDVKRVTCPRQRAVAEIPGDRRPQRPLEKPHTYNTCVHAVPQESLWKIAAWSSSLEKKSARGMMRGGGGGGTHNGPHDPIATNILTMHRPSCGWGSRERYSPPEGLMRPALNGVGRPRPPEGTSRIALLE